MAIYIAMLAFPALGALFGMGEESRLRNLNAILLVLLFLAYGLIIGFREQIGADWFGYLTIINRFQYLRLSTALTAYDPAFDIVAWSSTHIGFGVYGVNVVCGLLLLYGPFRFATTLPNPWLALSAAVPYLLVVVGMGYIRQAAAIGLWMLSFVQLQRGRYGLFTLSVLGALTFHVASLVLMPVVGIGLARRNPGLLIVTAILGILIFAYVLTARLASFQSAYLTAQMDSSGTLVRLIMTAIPSALFLALYRRFEIAQPMKDIWTVMAVIGLLLLVLFLVSPSTTVIDRIGLFFAPLQVMVFGYLTTVFGQNHAERQLARLVATAYCAAVLLVWLQFSFYARFWVPYHSIL